MPGTSLRLFLGAALAAGCGAQLNPSIPTPEPGALTQQPGAFVAYNLGCKAGCDEVRRGDLILAVDGRKIRSGADIDAVDLAQGKPMHLELFRRRTGETVAVDVVAEPYPYMLPIAHVPPFWTVGSEALDRAPAWARLKAFGHATPAMRLYQLDSPRRFVDGRDLFGRGALIVLWTPDLSKPQLRWQSYDMLPVWYGVLSARKEELRAVGVDPYWVFNGRVAEVDRRYVRELALGDGEWRADRVPMYANYSFTNNPNTRGLQHGAADLNELLFNDGRHGPIIVIVDPRGIVRWHSRGFDPEAEPIETLRAAVEFALAELPDGTDVLAAAPADPA